MSSPASDAFLDAWERYDSRRCVLAKIELTTPAALTMRYGSTEVMLPDGTLWQNGLVADGVTHGVGLLDPGVSPADASLRLAAGLDASQSSGFLSDLLNQYVFENALVTLYLWVQSGTDWKQVLDSADLFQIYEGRVSRPENITPTGFDLNLLQDQAWNFQTPPKVVDKVSYPNSPDGSQGMAIPTVYGDHSAFGMPPPWATAFGNKSKQEDAGAGSGVVPLVLVDAGVGNAKVKAVVAGHACADILDRANGYSAFISGAETLAPLDTAGITETLGSTESFLEIADESAIAKVAVIPMDVRVAVGGNTAGDPRNAMDPFSPKTFAVLDQGALKKELQLILPNPGALGRIESVEVSVAFIGNAANTQNLRINSFTPGVGAGASPLTTASTGVTPAVFVGTWPATYWDQNWQFGGGNTVLDLRVDFAGASAANKASIIWAVLVVKFRPQRSLVTPGGNVVNLPRNLLGLNGQFVDIAPVTQQLFPGFFRNIVEQRRLEGQFFGNVKGFVDDGSGTFTGTIGALIQRPPDILNHFLQTYGLVAPGDVETTPGATGSFKDARDTLRNGQPTDCNMACWIGNRTSVQKVVQQIAEQSGMCVYQDRFTSKWLAFVWKPGATVDFRRPIVWDDIAQFSCERSSVVAVRHAIRVKYGYDHFKSKTYFEAFVNATGSGQGVTLPTVRDQRLTVTTGVNDKYDFNFAGVKVATLAAGTYAPIDLAVELRSRIRTAIGSNGIDVSFGFTIKAGVNDKIDFDVAGTVYVATLRPGDYVAETLAVEFVRALNAVPGHGRTFSGSYSHSTNKFSFSATGTFRFYGTIGANFGTAALHALGFWSNALAASSITADRAMYSDRFSIAIDNPSIFNSLWSTGANTATNCADLTGFTRSDTGFVNHNSGTYSRGDRERVADTYQGYYGPKEERQITLDWVRDETTAVEFRNRLFDLTATPRVLVRFSSFRVPDMRVMQVFEFGADLDAHVKFPKYGSDGSWAGKAFRVLRVEQGTGPLYATSVLAVEA